jgi:dihydroorotate dehydrogenase
VNTYRIDRTYRWNYEHGPSFRGPFPRIPSTPVKDFLGHRVSSRVGISAGILLNSRWVECYARLGFDLLTYKTVRSRRRPCYPPPNWVYLETPRGAGRLQAKDHALRVASRRPQRASDVTSAVCFGMPSMEPEVWRRDVRKARRRLRRGQLLIVSVVGTPEPSGGVEALAEDYARCARWAAASGAHIVEANFSCPNVCTAEGSIYQDPRLSRLLATALRDVLPATPFLIKAGYFETPAGLRAFYRAVDDIADGVVLVNGMARRVLRADGKPAFRAHERVGILGRGIHAGAVANVQRAVALSGREKRSALTLAVGGVLEPRDASDFFEAGAAAVLLGGGAALSPLLAVRIKGEHPEW